MTAIATSDTDSTGLHAAEWSAPAFSSREFRNAMGQFASGVVVISVSAPNGAHAMTANAFMSGSLEPPLVVISVATTAKMHHLLTAEGGFGVSILASTQEKDSNHFAGRHSEGHAPQFDLLGETPVLSGAVVRLAAKTLHSYPCGDHTLFVGRVTTLETRVEEGARPLVYYKGGYRALVS